MEIKDTINKEKVYVASGEWNPDNQHKNTFKVDMWESIHDDVSNKDYWKHDIPEGLKEEKQ